jgi:Zn finger protein HypA/HybF involved in hydrogenase expression
MASLLTAIRHTTHNRAEIEASTVCGCCNCMQTFAPDEIIAWTGLDASNFDDPEALTGGTAMCPRCGSEAVVGDRSGYKIDSTFLGGMNEAWFQRTLVIHRPAPKA